MESVDSVRRSSVKNDHTPHSVLSGAGLTGSGSPNPKSLPPDATPTPPANLNLPRDRRPLSARASNNSDSIEDYIRNWKKNDTSPGASPSPSNSSSNYDQTSQNSSSRLVYNYGTRKND
jgi:hypothetical protein